MRYLFENVRVIMPGGSADWLLTDGARIAQIGTGAPP
jgi:hypothetical protein